MTQADRWKKRPCVVRYFSWCNQLRMMRPEVNWSPLSLKFVIEMPKSWSKKKKAEMDGKPHQSKPDLDNLIKAFKDALLKDDSKVWRYGRMMKVWGKRGLIIVDPVLTDPVKR